jgi:ethanolamine ammonia-lyase small subunit
MVSPNGHHAMIERFDFSDLRELFAKANEEKSGDQLAGIAARSERERVAAKRKLADLTLEEIVRRPLIDPSEDDVSRLILDPKVAVLLIGERPGLATAESLSAYMAYRPKAPHTDANRNLISNIHARGVSPEQAAQRILNLAASMMKTHTSGCQP